MPWKNGGGTTWEIARGLMAEGPAAEAGWHWRFSLAEIGQDGPFSSFPMIDRLLTVIAGTGIDLAIAPSAPRRLAPGEDIEFPGEAGVDCTLVDGPTRDLNVMVDRRAARLVPGRGEAEIALAAGDIALLYAMAEVRVRSEAGEIKVARGDALIGEGAGSARIEAGRAVWARVERRQA